MDVSRAHKLLEILRDNKIVLLVAALASIISWLVFAVGPAFPHLDDLLKSSASTPWGIMTSIFLHANLSHLSANMIGLWLWTGYVILPDGLLNREQIKQRLKWFLPIVLGSAIAANLLWLLFVPDGNSRGSSGLVFAISGVALGYSLMNLLKIVQGFKVLNQQFPRRRLISALISNLSTVGMFLVLIIFFTGYFLAVGPGVNSFAHGVAFLITFFYIMVRELVPYFRATVTSMKNSRK
jgi:membrane associated rhomboid family serine protease